MCAFIRCFPKVCALRKDSLEEAGELGTQSWLLLLGGSRKPCLAGSWFSDTQVRGFEKKHIEIKYTHTHVYIHISMELGIPGTMGWS